MGKFFALGKKKESAVESAVEAVMQSVPAFHFDDGSPVWRSGRIST